MEKLLSTADLAALLGVAPETVRYWRHIATGPPARKVGRYVRYRAVDVEAWLDAKQCVGISRDAT